MTLPVLADPQGDEAPAMALTTLLVKVASRCNLSCDYCYVYEHADQSWRTQPKFMSPETRDRLVARVAEYAREARPEQLTVLLHGGEPLLVGAEHLVDLSTRLRAAAGPDVTLHVGVQTNGILLDDQSLHALAAADIAISLSLDGPAAVHNQHRPDKAGRDTHAKVSDALRRLKTVPEAFAGVLAVIDADSDPAEVLHWFAAQGIPGLDLLLPDANHGRPPEGRIHDPARYERWLIEAFDVWYDQLPHLPLRTFDALLAAVCGLPSPTDAFGFGNLTLLTVETDGTYHDLDVLKTTFEGRTALDASLVETSIAVAAKSPVLHEHARLLTPAGLADVCSRCPEVDVCGGGAVAHRYRPDSPDPFSHPTVYCSEMLALIVHVRARLSRTLSQEKARAVTRGQADVLDWPAVDAAETGLGQLESVVRSWREASSEALLEGLAAMARTDSTGKAARAAEPLARAAPEVLGRVSTRASAQLWLRVQRAVAQGEPLWSLDGRTLMPRPADASAIVSLQALEPRSAPALHRDDPMLRLPFGHPVEFLPSDNIRVSEHRDGLVAALDVVAAYRPALHDELVALCSDVQLIRDVSAHPDKSVSFSDDSVPGAIYLAPPARWDELGVYDAADSLIHEHRHQKLYLVERAAELLHTDRPLIASPWREELRPPSGLLHALFVFTELLSYWRWVQDVGPATVQARACYLVESSTERLSAGFETMGGCALTPAGRSLVQVLKERTRR